MGERSSVMLRPDSPDEPRTRAEVEARLKSNSERMSRRIENIESEFPGKGSNVATIVRKAANWKTGAAIGAGLLVGLFLVRKRTVKIDYSDGLDRLSKDLTDEVVRQLQASDDVEEAVRKAVDKRPPMMQASGSERGMLSDALGVLLRSAAGLVAREGIEWMTRYLNRRRDPDADADTDSDRSDS